MKLEERLRRLKPVAGCDFIGGPNECHTVEAVNPDGPEAAAELERLKSLLEQAGEALGELATATRPFASHVGKIGTPVVLQIGKDKWTNTLHASDFTKASEALRKARDTLASIKEIGGENARRS